MSILYRLRYWRGVTCKYSIHMGMSKRSREIYPNRFEALIPLLIHNEIFFFFSDKKHILVNIIVWATLRNIFDSVKTQSTIMLK